MTDIFHEIQEDLRREKLRKLWERFGGLLIALVVLIVAGAAAWSGYKYWKAQQAIEASAGFGDAVALADAGKYAEAEAAFDALVRSGPAGSRAIAQFRAAAAAAARDKTAGIAAFDAIAADIRLDPLQRDIARVRAGLLLIDAGSLADVTQRVGDAAAGTGPLRNVAREALALAQMKAGDPAAAHATATRITEDGEATAGVRSRAELIRRLTAAAVPAAAPAAPAVQ